MRSKQDTLKVGLAIGAGTGPELAEIFQRTLLALAEVHHIKASLLVSPRRYQTYVSVARNAAGATDLAKIAKEDSAAYQDFLLELADQRCRAVFRTAFNAESLYLVREKLQCVKIETLPIPKGELLLIRDEAQGFYAGQNNSPASSPNIISRICEFRKETTFQILDFAFRTAVEHWGSLKKIDRVVAVYKFHLLDDRFARWISDYAKRRRIKIDLFQPDTMNRHLLRGKYSGNILILGSNEWMDIMHVDLLMKYGGFTQEEQFSRNVYLAARVKGVAEYQTVHGSADDIAGQGIVNPLATMRAAAAILERHGGRPRVRDRMEDAVRKAFPRRASPGSGKTQNTLLVMRQVLEQYAGRGTNFGRSFAA